MADGLLATRGFLQLLLQQRRNEPRLESWTTRPLLDGQARDWPDLLRLVKSLPLPPSDLHHVRSMAEGCALAALA